MRVPPGEVAGILRNPGSLAVVLLHGEDAGLVRQRAGQAARAILGDKDDPFRLSLLVREEHSRLADEARAISMTGGRRVVRVMDAGDALAPALSRFGEGPGEALVILEAGMLSARSKLRILVEKRRGWAAVACYPANPAAITEEIRSAAQAAGCSVAPEAAQSLVGVLPGDTAARGSEIQKLITFAGPGGIIDDEAVLACGADVAETSMTALFEAVMNGSVAATATLTQRVVDDGASGPGLIAAFGIHLQRLLKLRLLMDTGASAEAACERLQPPVYPRQAGLLIRQLRNWPAKQLMQVLAELRIADLACKRAGSRDATISTHLMLATARRAARG